MTGDYDFSEPLTMMRQRGFRTLLAQPQTAYPPFRDVTYFTWFWKLMRVGAGPTYQCTDFEDAEEDFTYDTPIVTTLFC